jgi:hypothetical protein
VDSAEFAWLRLGFFIHPIGSNGWGGQAPPEVDSVLVQATPEGFWDGVAVALLRLLRTGREGTWERSVGWGLLVVLKSWEFHQY